MVIDLWNKISLYCGNHTDDKKRKMELKTEEGKKDMFFYSCPDCRNRISPTDYEKMVNKLDSMLLENVKEGVVGNLTHTKWKTTKGIHYHIAYHDHGINLMDVYVVNKMEIK